MHKTILPLKELYMGIVYTAISTCKEFYILILNPFHCFFVFFLSKIKGLTVIHLYLYRWLHVSEGCHYPQLLGAASQTGQSAHGAE